ncbi:hypothetical protein CNMCM5623_006111 [Aspergillus felis]|uniref:Uncharacterized protein n=1 Tax=Aspergillus felis TaxID=1287682 RepID=A0A8H6QHR4_9EURO|nr:hypothetical protein CNMCM5623_006111 [Aspergillus felis]
MSYDYHSSICRAGYSSVDSETELFNFAEEKYLPVGLFPETEQPAPICRIQVNVMADGIILGFAFHHSIMDATGAGVIIRDFAKCCRLATGDRLDIHLEATPELQQASREILGRCTVRKNQGSDPSTETHPVESPREGLDHTEDLSAQAASFVKARYFRVPARKVKTLKDACNKVIRNSPSVADIEWKEFYVSSNDVFVSLLWMCLSRARYTRLNSAPSASCICMPVNIRNRVRPPIQSSYVGNALAILKVKVDMKILLTTAGSVPTLLNDDSSLDPKADSNTAWVVALSHIAHSIRMKLISMNQIDVQDLMAYNTEVADFSCNMPTQGNFHVSSWRDNGVYDSDFGREVGHPKDMQIPATKFDGECYILPKRPEEEPCWEVHLELQEDIMSRLDADQIWVSLISDG